MCCLRQQIYLKSCLSTKKTVGYSDQVTITYVSNILKSIAPIITPITEQNFKFANKKVCFRFAGMYIHSLPTYLPISLHMCKLITKFAINLPASKLVANFIEICKRSARVHLSSLHCWFAVKFATGLHTSKSKGLHNFARWQTYYK